MICQLIIKIEWKIKTTNFTLRINYPKFTIQEISSVDVLNFENPQTKFQKITTDEIDISLLRHDL